MKKLLFLFLIIPSLVNAQTIGQGSSGNTNDPWFVAPGTGITFTVGAINLDIRDLVFATDKVDVSGSSISGSGNFTVVQSTGTNLHVVCDSGCGGPTSFADNSAFAFGTTSIANIGFVFDDASPNTVTENNAATPRMSSNRVPYSQIRDAAGNERGVNVNASNELQVNATQGIASSINTGWYTNHGALTSTTGSFTVCTGGNVTASNLDAMSSALIRLSGGVASTANVSFEISDDGGTTWDNVAVSRVAAFAPVGTSDIYGGGVRIYVAPLYGRTTDLRILCNSGSTGGTITVRISPSADSLPMVGIANQGVAASSFSIPVVIAYDQSAVSTNVTSVTPGTGATNLGKTEDGGHTTGDIGVFALAVRKDGTAQVTSADTDYSQVSVDAYGVLYNRQDHPNRIACNITSTATTSTVVTGCAAPGANLSIYMSSLQWSSSIISTTTNFMTIQDGTGGNCGANITVHYRGFIPAAFNSVNVVFQTPIKIDANSEICFLHPGAGTRLVSIQGFIAP